MNAAAAHRTTSSGARELRQGAAGLPRLLDITDLRRGSGLFLTTLRPLVPRFYITDSHSQPTRRQA